MNHERKPAFAVLSALVPSLALAFVAGCGADDGPGYLPKPGEAAPLDADAIGTANSEAQAVVDAERAAGAVDLPAKGRSKR